MSEFEDRLNSILSSPKDMEKIMNLARSFSGGESGGGGKTQNEEKSTQPPPETGGFDPQLMGMLGRLMKGYTMSGNDRKFDILQSMKPYLRAERQAGLSRAVEIAKMAKIAKMAFSDFSGGEKNK